MLDDAQGQLHTPVPHNTSGTARNQTLALPPHILLVLSDDQGYADTGWTGNVLPTPTLDAILAQGGVELTSFYAHPLCTPTRERTPESVRLPAPGVPTPSTRQTWAE